MFLCLKNNPYLCRRKSNCLMETKFKMPVITWLRVTEFMRGWLEYEYGGGVVIKEQKVLSLLHLPGAREVFRLATVDDRMVRAPLGNAISSTRKKCIEAAMQIDEGVMKGNYGVTMAELEQFVPMEVPKMCVNDDGVLRPWTNDIAMGEKQATAMQRLLRDAFWQAVEDYDRDYEMLAGGGYPAVEMIEAFCATTKTNDIHVESMRREWQRRQRRARKANRQ